MKIRPRAVTTAIAAVGLAGATLVAAGPASAAPPGWENGANQLGTLRLYDAAGAAVVSGHLADDPFATYAVASTDDPKIANTSATLYVYTPVAGVDPLNWQGEQVSASTAFPVTGAGAPASIKNAGAHRPVATMTTQANGGTTLASYTGDFPNTNTDASGYAGYYQLRIKTLNNDPKYWAADILVSGDTWSLVYPSAAPTRDASSLTIGRSTAIAYGASTTLATTVKDTTTNSALTGRTVTLYSRTSTSSAWTSVGSATTSSTGVASKVVKPSRTTLYQWRYAGDTTHQAASSATETVSVRQVVAARSTKTTVRHGVAFKIYGTVKPASSGAKVSLQKLVGRTWKTLTAVTIKKQKLPSGVTTVGFVFAEKPARATYKFRVVKAATTTLLAGISSTLTVKVT